MKKQILLLSLFASAATINAENSKELGFSGFEVEEGFPVDFLVNKDGKWIKNGYTGTFWNNIYTTSESKNYNAVIQQDARPGSEGSQSMKITVFSDAFIPKNDNLDPVVRVRTNDELFNIGVEVAEKGNVYMTYWAKLDGDQDLPVIKNGNKTTIIEAGEWKEYTTKVDISSANPDKNLLGGSLSFNFIPLEQEADYSYAMNIDDMVFWEDMTPTSIEGETENKFSCVVKNKRLYIYTTGMIDELSVININGSTVKTINNVDASIDLSDLNNGIYIVKAQQGNSFTTSRIVIM